MGYSPRSGGIVFVGFTMMLFRAIGMNAEMLVGRVIVPSGLAGVLLVASYLVEAKQSVVENMAPVLTRLFTPLFTVLLLAFLGTMVWTGNPINVERQILIGFDLLLALVVGLVVYAASARDPQAPPAFFDRLQLVLVLSALTVDAVALAAGLWAGGERCIVMMQNSGLGNAVSPLSSLTEMFGIPLLMVVTQRGAPGVADEPQHALMGRITTNLLELLGEPVEAPLPSEAE